LQLPRPSKIRLLNENRAFVDYWLALALTTIAENSGNMYPISKFVQVRKPPAAVGLRVFSVGIILGCAQVIPEITISTETGDGQNKPWIVNRHIDLEIGVMCIIDKKLIAFCVQVEGTRGEIFAKSPIALQS